MKWYMNMKTRPKLLTWFTIISIIGWFIGYMGYSAIKRIEMIKVYDFTVLMIMISIIVGISISIILGLKISKIISESIENLNTDINSLKDAIGEGEFGTRIDETKHNGYYKEIIQGVNKTIDSLTEPLNESRKVLGSMAANDLTVKMTSSYKGMMKEFADNINSVNSRIANVVKLNTEISVGDIKGIEEISKIGKRSENDELMPTMVIMMSTIKDLIEEIAIISDAAVKGNLDVRSDVSKFQGGYREIIEGFNRTLDAITKPINESKKVLASMAVNDLTIKMTGSYEGVMKELADNINSVNERILSISDLFTQVSLGDTSRLEDLNKIGKRSENDKLLPAMILMMSTIQNLIKEISVIADGAIDGKLETRSDILKFHGGFRDILEGLNKTLDAVEAPINESAEVLKEMEAGNLCVNMIGNYKGSYQIIKDSLNHTIESFNKLLGNITEASEQVLAGSNQVSDGSQALSQGTTEQASAIEELTSSITQVAAQTKQNAVNASQANELGINAKEVAILGNSHMKEMLKSMEEINVSSSNISKIIKVIDDIAFQTNMLALNAAVEAARAGQHGKGFAVVAEEVRNLAARSAKAAKETTDLVEGSIKKVEFGTKIANNTAESLNQIVLGVSKAATLVGEIAAASNEQATAIYQINKGIEQVSDVVQTNSATSEQSAAASEELSSQAAMLKNMVGKFNLKGSTSLAHNEISLEAQRNSNQIKNRFLTKDEVAVTKSKPVISLSNMEFGKY
ncbi:methyl-accepting chemotaxis protein [Clostridium estertheticum]|uniref:methyl-accepting chemotaxis protein n=1 Tax=Clostridium estertheticum TaxID=238834 RepID=UPI00209ADC70|nr:methyl-accepting chemotaxis protein [Clostridium estertheticum]